MIVLGVDIGTTKICAILAQRTETGKIKILGAGITKSQGIKKGNITNIELASRSIKHAINDAKRVAGTHFDQVIVSVSGAYTKGFDSQGVVNVPSKEIGIKEINRVMQMADHNANIPAEYEKLHVLPYNFKVDDHVSIDDPLGMNGSRLEVQVHIITVLKSSLNNLKKAVKSASLEIDNVVLSGYASSIAVLNDDEKELGAAVVDMGGATTDIVIHLGNSIRYNDFLPVGSVNVTNDLSMALHTPITAAEKVKIEHGSLKLNSNETIELPAIGDEGSSHEVSLEIVTNVIYARIEETLLLIAKSIKESGFRDQLAAGIVLTGGLTKLDGIRELASAIFNNTPVRLARPNERDIEGMFDTLKDPEYATAIGLILYGFGYFTPYEMDSNKKLRYKDESIEPSKIQNILDEEVEEEALEKELGYGNSESGESFTALIDDEPTLRESLKRFWNRITQLF
ncbi:MAG TPA: cell division protein FtsA [Campylobacteraceae bacterium]|nr:cell division protein FtsA [Campylobacteraceae bacterium]